MSKAPTITVNNDSHDPTPDQILFIAKRGSGNQELKSVTEIPDEWMPEILSFGRVLNACQHLKPGDCFYFEFDTNQVNLKGEPSYPYPAIKKEDWFVCDHAKAYKEGWELSVEKILKINPMAAVPEGREYWHDNAEKREDEPLFWNMYGRASGFVNDILNPEKSIDGVGVGAIQVVLGICEPLTGIKGIVELIAKVQANRLYSECNALAEVIYEAFEAKKKS
ncbi:MAG: hypothetical protein F6K50_06360 [Moorea sp. SIO3I7]|nr:hypothetical protein [Moorena sp. SIO3I7]